MYVVTSERGLGYVYVRESMNRCVGLYMHLFVMYVLVDSFIQLIGSEAAPGARDVVLNKTERARPLGVIGSYKYINEDVLLNAWLGSMIMLGYGPARVGL